MGEQPKEYIITDNQLMDLLTGHLDIEDQLRIGEFVRSRPAPAALMTVKEYEAVVSLLKKRMVRHGEENRIRFMVRECMDEIAALRTRSKPAAGDERKW